MNDAVHVRWATGPDADAIAEVMCRALQAAYLGPEYVSGVDAEPRRGSVVPQARRRLAALTPDELVDGIRAGLEAGGATDRTLVAVVDGEVVGCHRLRLDGDDPVRPVRASPAGPGGSGSTPAEASLTGEVASLYVDPAAWQAGSGARLLEVGLDQLARDGCHQAWLWVADENERAKRFYRRRGFAPDGTRRPYRMQLWGVDLGFDLTVVRFVCDLDPPEPEAQGGASEHHDPGDPATAELGSVGSGGSSQRPRT